jgi:hypothetical protein
MGESRLIGVVDFVAVNALKCNKDQQSSIMELQIIQ